MQEQSKQIYGDPAKATELWSQFLSFQGPAMQSLMSTYMEQSKNMFQQMQEQLQSQTRTMFTGFPFGAPGKGGEDGAKPGEGKPDSKS
jgi:polyhydroxyalkanoate synthesis regulator protein